jgi:hypothetical protein
LIGDNIFIKKDFDMSLVLENIIRQVLLEAVSGTLKNASKKQLAKAEKAGAKFAYAVKIKGETSPVTIARLISNVSETSAPSSDPMTVSVGTGGPYATKNYIYVHSEPIGKKRQLINVWIMPKSEKWKELIDVEAGGKDKDGVRRKTVPVTELSTNRIGGAILISVKRYNNEAIQLGIPELQIDSEEDLTGSKGQLIVDYPYKWESGTGDIMVYSVPSNMNNNQEDTLVYIKQNNKWMQYDKVRFQSYLNNEDAPPKFEKVQDAAKIQLLDDIVNPPDENSKRVKVWNQKNQELFDNLSKAKKAYEIQHTQLKAAFNQATLTGGAAELESAQTKLTDFETNSKEAQNLKTATDEYDQHQKQKPGAAAADAKNQAEKGAENEKNVIDPKTLLDLEKDNKYIDQDVINATKTSKYSDVTKWFQQLMIDKITNAGPNLEKALKNLNLETRQKASVPKDVYTPFKADGQWGTKSKDLTKALKVMTGLTGPYTGELNTEIISKIKNIVQRSNESKIIMKKTITEQIIGDLSQYSDDPSISTNQNQTTPKKISNQNQSSDQNQTTPKKITPKPKSDSKLQPGKQYKLELKDTKLYYFNNSTKNFFEAEKMWKAPSSMYLKYVTTSKHNPKYILIDFGGILKLWAPLDKVSKITPL